MPTNRTISSLPLLPAAIFLLLTGALVLSFSCGKRSGGPGTGKPLNIVIVVSDALRQDLPGCYGGPADTPNLDWLAQHGVLFENAYSTSPWTAPSSVSMFTGNYATSYGFVLFTRTIQINVPQSELLLSEVLNGLGYETLMKIENRQAEIHGNLQGFEPLPEPARLDDDLRSQLEDSLEHITGRQRRLPRAYKESLVFLDYLLNLPAGQRFFTINWMNDPHCPYSPVPAFKERIQVNRPDLPRGDEFYSRCKLVQRDVDSLSAEEIEYIKNLYAAEVESMDERVGFILAILKYKQLMDNTVVVFTSDHGEQFGDHGLWGHGAWGRNAHYYEGLVKVPLIIMAPGLPRGKRVAQNVSLVDMMPTLKELLGIDYDEDMQGRSFLSSMLKDHPRDRTLYFDDIREHEQIDALLDRSFKLICAGPGRYELYDLSGDEAEEHNLAAADPDRVGAMSATLLSIREQIRRRQLVNIAAFDTSSSEIDIQKQKMLENLKSLGYIK